MVKNKVLLILAVLIVVGVAAYFIFWYKPAPKNPVQQLDTVTGAIPEIGTNPLENKVPELNAVEVANPFRYKNPLR